MAQGKKKEATGYIEIGEGKDGKFRFFVRDDEDKLLAMSSPGGFATVKDAQAGIETLKQVIGKAKVSIKKKDKDKDKDKDAILAGLSAFSSQKVRYTDEATDARCSRFLRVAPQPGLGFPLICQEGTAKFEKVSVQSMVRRQ